LAVFFYNLFLLLFRAFMPLSSPFNEKARKWARGRKGIFEKIETSVPKDGKIIWVHCASLGEFEQGRPVMEKLKAEMPEYKILLTFFSPSGYEVQKNYPGADWVFYLPMDSAANAKRFLDHVQPKLVIFVKYEFWYYYLKKIKYREIPLLLISALFRKDMSFFKWYGELQRKMLSRFDHVFVQNDTSKKLVDEIGLASICSVSGDTRFDRVIAIAEKFQTLPAIEKFVANNRVLIAGSTWKEDDDVLAHAIGSSNASLRIIIAPHEISAKRIQEIKDLFPGAVTYSDYAKATSPLTSQCLIIDNIGMLSKLYRYGYLTYVGGAMSTKGVHNVLEAAVYNKIVFFGPYYQKYSEAIGLLQSGGGISFNDNKKDGQLLRQLIEALLGNETEYQYRSKAAGAYVRSNAGATERIMRFIQEKRLLTN
jgi:3-deoxy-D-manno-octulosonic-acid transferase